MANDPRSPPSNYPPAMGPGARPVNPTGDGGDARTKLMQVIQARSKYQVSVEPETLSLSYELNDSPRLYRLSFDAMPLQGFSRWWLYGGPQRARRAGVLAIDIIRGSENIAQRPVTQQEAEALTYWTSKRLLYGSYATVIGVALGTYIARRGHAKMKFPILSAKPLEQYNHFPLKQVPILTGQTAQTAWQFTRYSVWIQLAFLVATPVVGTVGSFSVATGMAQDSRTQELVHALKERGKSDLNTLEWPEKRRQSPSGAESPPQVQNSGPDPEPDFQPDFRDPEQGNSLNQVAQRGESVERAFDGTLGGREYNPGDTFQSDDASNTGVFSDASERDHGSKMPYGQHSNSRQPPSQIQSTSSPASADSDPFFYDDASPTAGSAPNNVLPTVSNAPSGGSVWDRIRRGGAPQPQPQPQSQSARNREIRSSRQAEAEADSNERNAYNNEARLGSGTLRDGKDREQAQREFDEMLERERQQSGSEEYDRGMRAVEQGEEGRRVSGSGNSAWERRRRE